MDHRIYMYLVSRSFKKNNNLKVMGLSVSLLIIAWRFRAFNQVAYRPIGCSVMASILVGLVPAADDTSSVILEFRSVSANIVVFSFAKANNTAE